MKKQDVRDIYGELGKELKEGLSFNEFSGVMTSRMVHKIVDIGRKRLQIRNFEDI